jgi:ATP/ADP translocase
MVLALFVAQYIYSDHFVRAYPDPAGLAVFISVYLAVTNLVEIALELWVTPWLIRRFGVATSHVVHPVLTFVSFVALFVQPVLGTALAARANRASWRRRLLPHFRRAWTSTGWKSPARALSIFI